MIKVKQDIIKILRDSFIIHDINSSSNENTLLNKAKIISDMYVFYKRLETELNR
jgi:hypothetical protein